MIATGISTWDPSGRTEVLQPGRAGAARWQRARRVGSPRSTRAGGAPVTSDASRWRRARPDAASHGRLGGVTSTDGAEEFRRAAADLVVGAANVLYHLDAELTTPPAVLARAAAGAMTGVAARLLAQDRARSAAALPAARPVHVVPGVTALEPDPYAAWALTARGLTAARDDSARSVAQLRLAPGMAPVVAAMEHLLAAAERLSPLLAAAEPRRPDTDGADADPAQVRAAGYTGPERRQRERRRPWWGWSEGTPTPDDGPREGPAR